MNHICLEVTTKDGTFRLCTSLTHPTHHSPHVTGNIIVFIPPNFTGGLQFRSHRPRSTVTFLPHFAQRARVIQGADKESFVLYGNSDLLLSDPKNADVDLCLLSTHSGLITVGVAGEDFYEEPKPPPGFWQKMFGGGDEKKDAEETA